MPFYCLLCTTELNAEIFTLNYLDKIELNELNGNDLHSHLSHTKLALN